MSADVPDAVVRAVHTHRVVPVAHVLAGIRPAQALDDVVTLAVGDTLRRRERPLDLDTVGLERLRPLVTATRGRMEIVASLPVDRGRAHCLLSLGLDATGRIDAVDLPVHNGRSSRPTPLRATSLPVRHPWTPAATPALHR